MAARRLLIVMLVLLGLSTLAAALIPSQETRDGTGTTATTEETQSVPPDPVRGGRLLKPVKIAAGGKSEVIPLRAGDQLPLTVTSRKTDLVEIPALGLVEPVGPAKPAHFDLFLEDPDSYGIRLVSADKLAARIVVTKPGKPGKRGKPGKKR